MRKIILIALFYAALSFAFSFIGFVHPESASGPNEYSPSKLLIEITGHFLFGFIASLPLLDIKLCALTGALAVLIDSDHILSSLGLNVLGRPDHSAIYVLVSLVALLYAGRKLGFDQSTLVKLGFVAPITVLSHLSYDIFAGTGAAFPLLEPFDFGSIFLPSYAWVILEGFGILLAFCGYLVAKRLAATSYERKLFIEQSALNRQGRSGEINSPRRKSLFRSDHRAKASFDGS